MSHPERSLKILEAYTLLLLFVHSGESQRARRLTGQEHALLFSPLRSSGSRPKLVVGFYATVKSDLAFAAVRAVRPTFPLLSFVAVAVIT